MKKLTAIFFVIALLALNSVFAFADMDGPEFDDWYVYCGLGGYNYSDDYESVHVDPGVKLQVYWYNDDDRDYTLMIDDDDFKYNGSLIVVSERDLDECFVDSSKVVSEHEGNRLSTPVNGVVDPGIGVVLRNGPAKGYKKITTMPKGTKVSYQYTYNYGGYNWGYVSYKGHEGWACIDYIKTVATATTEKTTQKKTEPTTEKEKVVVTDRKEEIHESRDGNTSAETNPTSESAVENEFFSNTTNVIIVCAAAAIIVAITAAVIIIILISKKK